MNLTLPPQASVSVIVTGHGPFIEAIESILAQTLPPAQIIIVDDGASAAVQQVRVRYTDPKFQYFRQEHPGVAAARNTGLGAARCEYIAFLNADDHWRPTFLETMHGFLAADPTVVCVFCNFVRFQHDTGKLLGDQFESYPELRRPVLLRDAPNAYARIPKERAFSALVACADIPSYLQAMMFRRDLIGTARFDQSLALGDDLDFALRTFMLGGVMFTDEVLAEVRCRDADDLAARTLTALKALAPLVTGTADQAAFRERLIRAHIDAALSQAKLGRARAGFGTYRDIFAIPGSTLRKLKGSLRMALALLAYSRRTRRGASG